MFNTIDSTKAKMMIAMPLTMYKGALENLKIVRKLVADLESGATDFDKLAEQVTDPDTSMYSAQMNAFPELSDLVDRAMGLIKTRESDEDLEVIKEFLEERQSGSDYVYNIEDMYEDLLPRSRASRAISQLCYEGVVLIPNPGDHSNDRYIVQELPGMRGTKFVPPVKRLVLLDTDVGTKRSVSWEPDVFLHGHRSVLFDQFEHYVVRAAYKLVKQAHVMRASDEPSPTKRVRAD
jgi:hypothetical protein